MTRDGGVLARALAVPAALYAWVMRRRNRRLDRPGAATRVPVPVVSVGNVTVGGTGKTPAVAWIVRHLLAAGRRPAIVSRGYRGTAGAGPVVVSDGSGPPRGGPALAGDEPWLLARAIPRAIVVVGSDRVAGALRAAECGADVVVLDDGFQHRRLARDLDVVLLDADDPLGNGRVLPAGPLREPPDGLSRSDVVLLTRARPGEEHDAARRAVARWAPGVPVVLAAHEPAGFVDADGADVPRPRRALAFCGIAAPESFRTSLESCGVEVAELVAFRDHHRFGRGELERLASRARSLGVALVTTEKDLARLDGGGLPAGSAPLALRVRLEPRDPAALVAAIDRALARDGR